MSDSLMNDDSLHLTDEYTEVADHTEENLVTDARGNLSPAEMIERKLGYLLKNGSLPVSHLRVGRRTIRAR